MAVGVRDIRKLRSNIFEQSTLRIEPVTMQHCRHNLQHQRLCKKSTKLCAKAARTGLNAEVSPEFRGWCPQGNSNPCFCLERAVS
jgi:hypothetical protein